MTCQEMIDFLLAYVDEELAPEQRQVFDEHLRCACLNARALLLASAGLGPADEPIEGIGQSGLLVPVVRIVGLQRW